MRMTPHPVDVCPARIRALLTPRHEVVDVVREGADAADVGDEALGAEDAGFVEHTVQLHAADADEGAGNKRYAGLRANKSSCDRPSKTRTIEL